jgi:ferritin-like protein
VSEPHASEPMDRGTPVTGSPKGGQVTDHGHTRRRFLVGAGALAAGGIALAACGDDGSAPRSTTETTVGPASRLGEDLRIAALAASLENLTASTYQAGIDAAATPRVGAVPDSVMRFMQTAKRHHDEHAAAWNAILTSAGRTRVTDPDQVLKPQIDQAFGQVNGLASLVRLVLSLESIAAATYLSGIAAIQNNQVLKVAASIHPVELQHAAVLNFFLGNYPVPDAFARTDGARPSTDYPAGD